MSKILGIDYGTHYIGLAIAEAREKLAMPYAVIVNDDTLFPSLDAVMKTESITGIVCGWPLSLKGHENEITKLVAQFIEALELRYEIPVHRTDERFTSTAVRQKGIRKRQDDKAAAQILQSYLDRHDRSDH